MWAQVGAVLTPNSPFPNFDSVFSISIFPCSFAHVTMSALLDGCRVAAQKQEPPSTSLKRTSNLACGKVAAQGKSKTHADLLEILAFFHAVQTRRCCTHKHARRSAPGDAKSTSQALEPVTAQRDQRSPQKARVAGTGKRQHMPCQISSLLAS